MKNSLLITDELIEESHIYVQMQSLKCLSHVCVFY